MWLNGTQGENFQPITPCNRLPLAAHEEYEYLTILNGLFTTLEDAINPDPIIYVVDWLKDTMDYEKVMTKAISLTKTSTCIAVGHTCSLSSNCCNSYAMEFYATCNSTEQCNIVKKEFALPDYVYEPMCILWSCDSTDCNKVDTIGWMPASAWPPVRLGLPSTTFFLKCLQSCKSCKLTMGIPLQQFVIREVLLQSTAKFG